MWVLIMKNTILYFLSAIAGILIGVIMHCSFMIVQNQGVLMLPEIEPEEHVIINLLDKNMEVGDIVALEPEYYTLDGEGNIIFRRVVDVSSKNVVLTCDVATTRERILTIPKEKILGTALGIK